MLCVMSKMDLVKDKKGRLKREVGRYLDPDPDLLLEDANVGTNPKFHALNRAVVGLVSLLSLKDLADIRSRTRISSLSCPWM